MQRYFNTEGSCNPNDHYMVRLDERLDRIKKRFVDRGKYFVINRGRQYGKTTTLQALAEYLATDYIVLSMDFQAMGTEDFADAAMFSRAFAGMVSEILEREELLVSKESQELLTALSADREEISLKELFAGLSRMCAEASKPMVLMIDEVDSASNNRVFVDFLAQLRGYYLVREKKSIFHSVILAGVYDIKNLKLKLRTEAEHKYNSPWNIAAKFNIDMSFSVDQIASMLQEYESDKQTGMKVEQVAASIYEYTSGYPYLVSAICKILDEDLSENPLFDDLAKIWSQQGIVEAVKGILVEQIPLFESMVRQLEEFPEMRQTLRAVLFSRKRISYNPDTLAISLASMFGYIVNREGCIQVANRIFEMRIYNLFLSEEELSSAIYDRAQGNMEKFIRGGRLDMDLVVEKFVMYFHDIYGEKDERFLEDQGRKLFLLYLKPIINGTGNYYIEAQTRDSRRTDVIVDYLGEQFVIELKIWHGNEYNERGEKQLSDYLDYYHKDKGYLISFNFNKGKTVGIRKIQIGAKTIVEAVV